LLDQKKLQKKIKNKRLLLLSAFFNGQPFHLAALKKTFTRIGTAFVRAHARVSSKIRERKLI
jgi:hypothetical protein